MTGCVGGGSGGGHRGKLRASCKNATIELRHGCCRCEKQKRAAAEEEAVKNAKLGPEAGTPMTWRKVKVKRKGCCKLLSESGKRVRN